MVEKLTLSWSALRDLDLDPENPRHERGLSRPAVIAQFIKRENIRQLARDIAQHGLSPLERFGAIKDAENELVVVEGNRRLCALMLLHDPALAPTPDERRAFERLGRNFDTTKIQIELEVFESREEANIWLERKHLGENNGLGTKGWRPVEQARHFGDTANTLALAVLDYAVEKRLVSPRPDGILTTVTRFMSNPFVRKHALLITTGAGDAEFSFNGTRALFNRRLQRLLTDIINGTNGATSRTSAEDREAYAKKHLLPMSDEDEDATADDPDVDAGTDVDDNDAPSADGTTPSGGTETGETGAVESKSDQSEATSDDTQPGTNGQEPDNGTEDTAAHGGGTANAPNKRNKLVEVEHFHPSMRDHGLRRILGELHLVTRRTPTLAAVGVRIFIEAITVSYLENRMNQKIQDRYKLHMIVHQAVGNLKDQIQQNLLDASLKQKNALQLLSNKITDPGYVYSAAYLGAVAHGTAFPQWEHVTAAWDEISPALMLLATNCEKPLEGREE